MTSCNGVAVRRVYASAAPSWPSEGDGCGTRTVKITDVKCNVFGAKLLFITISAFMPHGKRKHYVFIVSRHGLNV